MRNLRWWLLITFVILLGGGAIYWTIFDLPSLDKLQQGLVTPSVRITDRQGRLLYEALPTNGGRNTPLPLDQIPLALQQATIATEDSSFYQNPGVDLRGILRAVWINLRGGETLSGGSTITQQVARSLLLDPQERGQRSWRRKLREGILAWQLTRRFSKDEILALYLNQTYYGGMAYGVEAAAQTYFGKPAQELDLAESALLAGLPQTPAFYNPFTHLEAARQRQAVVLGLMEKAGYISTQEREMAEREVPVLASTPYPLEAPHYVMMVRSQIDELFTPEEVQTYGGLEVRTSLDLDTQKQAEKAVQDQLKRLHDQEKQGQDHNLNDAALVALDPHNGQILAMVGSPDYDDAAHAGAVNMALAPRQPGSALKPLIYAAAFDPTRPQPWTAATMLLDVRTNFVTHDNQPYTPVNYDGVEHGPVLAREALASSLNIPAVLTLDHIGLPALYDLARRMGISNLGDPNTADLSLALGGGDVSLLELTSAYASFANGGHRVEPLSILDVRTLQGKIIYTQPAAPPQQVLDERVAWLITDILTDDHARLLGFSHDSVLRLDRPAAVKTGTTTDFHDNWAVGYTPDLVVGVWAGNANHEAMRDITGLTGAAPIWAQALRSMLAGTPATNFIQPRGLTQVEVCALSGMLPSPNCPFRKLEWFITDTEPNQHDTMIQNVELDTRTGQMADNNTPPDRRVEAQALDLPPQAGPWARARGLLLLSELLEGKPTEKTAPQTGASPDTNENENLSLRMIAPADQSTYVISSRLPMADQRLHLEVVGETNLQRVTLFVDGQPVANMVYPPYEGWWGLATGIHEAWAAGIRSDGTHLESSHVHFTVKQ